MPKKARIFMLSLLYLAYRLTHYSTRNRDGIYLRELDSYRLLQELKKQNDFQEKGFFALFVN